MINHYYKLIKCIKQPRAFPSAVQALAPRLRDGSAPDSGVAFCRTISQRESRSLLDTCIFIYIYIHIHLAPETGSTHGRRDRMIPSWGSSPYLMPIFYGFHHMQHASFPIQLYWRHSIQNLTTSKRTANWLEASVCLDLAGGHELLFWLLNRLVYFLYGYLSPK